MTKVYFFTNSVGLRVGKWIRSQNPIEPHSFMQILWAYYHFQLENYFDTVYYTVLDLYYDSQRIKFEKDDIVVINVGVNDCQIHGSDKYYCYLIDKFKKRDNEKITNFLQQKLDQFNQKNEEKHQMVTFDEFEYFLDKVFESLPQKVIVLSIGYNERWYQNISTKVNEILKRKSEKYRFVFIDLWSQKLKFCDNIGNNPYDGVHFGEGEHQWIADKLYPYFVQWLGVGER